MTTRTSRLSQIPHITTPWRGEDGGTGRDMECIREMLLECEGGGGVRDLAGWSDETLRDHLRLMIEAGLLHGSVDAGGGVVFGKLTWAGHDFLAAIRQDTVWRSVRARLAAAGGGIAFDSIKQIALSFLP